MTTWNYTFRWLDATTSGSNWVAFSNVQSGNISYQRDSVTDSLPRLTGRLQGRRPDLMPAIQIGDGIEVACEGYSEQFFVADYKINYDIVSNGDTWTLDLEDITAKLGRYYGDFSWADGARSRNTYGSVIDRVASYDYPTGADTSIQLSAQSLTAANGAQVARSILDSMQATQTAGYWFTYSVSPPIFFVGGPNSWQNVSMGPTFSDGTVTPITSGQWKFDAVDFASLANQYWDKVTCQPAGLSAQTSGTGLRGYTFQTYNQTINTAAIAAASTLNRTNVKSRVPIRVSSSVATQTGAITAPDLTQIVTVYLRGSTYYAYVLGVDYTFNPQNTRVTVELTSYESVNYLKLNDSVLGRLDYNKLGF